MLDYQEIHDSGSVVESDIVNTIVESCSLVFQITTQLLILSGDGSQTE